MCLEISRGWKSLAFAVKQESPLIVVTAQGPGPIVLAAALRLNEHPVEVQLERRGENWQVVLIDSISSSRVFD